MARKGEGQPFNICVIGLSDSEHDKGQCGVGKSCLCNRFIYQVADKYHSEHISVLSQSDFAGRVINNDHFLYWGDVTKTDEGNNYTFQVIEQTEFIDDVSFQPFKSGRTEPYIKRCTATKVQSAEKLMYICKEQLGMETDSSYEQKLMPEGRLNIDGFLCCCDVSQTPQRSCEKQLEFVASLLSACLKTKKPVVLVSTKQEEADEQIVRDLERLIARREFKGIVSLVETSAHENVNIEAAFMLLAHLIDRTKPRFKILPYVDAARQRREVCQIAADAYRSLLRSTVNDPRALWSSVRRHLQAEHDFNHYIDVFGTEQARKEFRRHIRLLRDEQVRVREHHYLQQLPRLLKHYLPNIESVTERGWLTIQHDIQNHPDFSSHFVEVCEPGESWKQTEEFLDNKDEQRIPFDLLHSSEGEHCFRNHLRQLQVLEKKKELQHQFRKLLEENIQVSVGRPLSETYVFLVGKECYAGLEERERAAIYEEHQQHLKVEARHAFYELLWEHSQLFWKMSATQRLTAEDLVAINTALQQDDRYRALSRAEEERKVMILNHLGFLQCPSRDRCYYREACIDNQLVQFLASLSTRSDVEERRPVNNDSSDSSSLNLVLLGQDGLAIALNKDIRRYCVDDEYVWGDEVYSLDYRPIDGDVSREQNALSTANFKPHGCLCVYDSEETLLYIQHSLEQWLVWQGDRDKWMAHGMPFVLMQARCPSSSHKEHIHLREQGQQLAHRLHTDFVEDVTDDEWEILEDDDQVNDYLFTVETVNRALQSVISHRNQSTRWPFSATLQPDIRICMCLMCGDPFSLEVPLGPLITAEDVKVAADNPYALTLQAYLEGGRQLVEIEVSSYHGRPVRQHIVRHGYILVYSAQRQASLAALRSYACHLPAVPKLIVAVADSGGAAQLFFHSETSQALIRHGNKLADELGAVFITTTANFSQQTAAYLPFFREALELREQSEAACLVPMDEPCPPAYEEERVTHMDRRPPAPLPKYYDTYHTSKSSTSNSQSTDSEPVYDQPNLYQSHYSDSEHERASSASPACEDIYSEVQTEETDDQPVPSGFARPRRDGPHGELVGAKASWRRCKTDGDAPYTYSDKSRSPRHWKEGAGRSGREHAPLALPEPIEIADYSLVKDAVAPEEGDCDYASVDDALPPGQLHRIRSTKSPNRFEHPDSEESEFSSLEREIKSTRTRSSRQTGQRKSRHKNSVGFLPPGENAKVVSPGHPKQAQACNYSGSDGSEGTGDELQGGRQEKQRQSLRTRKLKAQFKQHPVVVTPPATSPSLSDGLDGEETYYEPVRHFQTLPGRQYRGPISAEEEDFDLNDNWHWSNRIPGFKTLRDPEKQRKKEERRRLKEEEKKLKESQKRKKKENKSSHPSQSGFCLEEFPTSSIHLMVPQFVEKCITYIETEGVNTEGLYRIPGNRAQGEYFVSKYHDDTRLASDSDTMLSKPYLPSWVKQDPHVDISTLDIPVNAIATVLKSFFNDLTEPLIPRELHDELIEAAGVPDKSSRLLMLRGVIKKLPEQNFEVLKYLISHLHRVSEHHDQNNMDGRNLSRCWWPTIMRMEFSSYETMLQFSAYTEDIVLTLIHQFQFFFFGGNEI